MYKFGVCLWRAAGQALTKTRDPIIGRYLDDEDRNLTKASLRCALLVADRYGQWVGLYRLDLHVGLGNLVIAACVDLLGAACKDGLRLG